MIEGTEQRERYWKELALAEQVERMRAVVRVLERRVSDLERCVAEFESHDHVNGRLMVTHLSRQMGLPLTPFRDPEWF